MIDRRRALVALGGAAVVLGGLWSVPGMAAFPDKPVTMVVGFGAWRHDGCVIPYAGAEAREDARRQRRR